MRLLSQALIALGESRGTSLYTTLLAAFQVFLSRYSGQSDILVGSPVAGRTRPGLEGLIGYFVNMVPLRSDLSGNPTFEEFLGQVAGPSPWASSIKISRSVCW